MLPFFLNWSHQFETSVIFIAFGSKQMKSRKVALTLNLKQRHLSKWTQSIATSAYTLLNWTCLQLNRLLHKGSFAIYCSIIWVLFNDLLFIQIIIIYKFFQFYWRFQCFNTSLKMYEKMQMLSQPKQLGV